MYTPDNAGAINRINNIAMQKRMKYLGQKLLQQEDKSENAVGKFLADNNTSPQEQQLLYNMLEKFVAYRQSLTSEKRGSTEYEQSQQDRQQRLTDEETKRKVGAEKYGREKELYPREDRLLDAKINYYNRPAKTEPVGRDKYSDEKKLNYFKAKAGISEDPNGIMTSPAMTAEQANRLKREAERQGIFINLAESEKEDTGSGWNPFDNKTVKQYKVSGIALSPDGASQGSDLKSELEMRRQRGMQMMGGQEAQAGQPARDNVQRGEMKPVGKLSSGAIIGQSPNGENMVLDNKSNSWRPPNEQEQAEIQGGKFDINDPNTWNVVKTPNGFVIVTDSGPVKMSPEQLDMWKATKKGQEYFQSPFSNMQGTRGPERRAKSVKESFLRTPPQ